MNILNDELIALCFSNLHIKDIINIQLTCYKFNKIINSEIFRCMYKWIDMLDDLKLEKYDFIIKYNFIKHIDGIFDTNKTNKWNFLCGYYLYPNENWNTIGLCANNHLNEYINIKKSFNHNYRNDIISCIWNDDIEILDYFYKKSNQWLHTYIDCSIEYHSNKVFDYIINACDYGLYPSLIFQSSILYENIHVFRWSIQFEVDITSKIFVHALNLNNTEIKEFVIKHYDIGLITQAFLISLEIIKYKNGKYLDTKAVKYILDNYSDQINYNEFNKRLYYLNDYEYIKIFNELNIDDYEIRKRSVMLSFGLFKLLEKSEFVLCTSDLILDNLPVGHKYFMSKIFKYPLYNFKRMINLGYFYAIELKNKFV